MLSKRDIIDPPKPNRAVPRACCQESRPPFDASHSILVSIEQFNFSTKLHFVGIPMKSCKFILNRLCHHKVCSQIVVPARSQDSGSTRENNATREGQGGERSASLCP
jgi:hypothetical protein